MQRKSSLIFSVCVLMVMVLPAVFAAALGVTRSASAQYNDALQYGAAAPQYGAAAPQYASDGQYGAATTPSCEQSALDALSSPTLGSNSAQDNRKLLSEFVKCGGEIASLPQASFNALLRQGNIELEVARNGTFACPRGDRTNCSAVPGM